MMNRDELKAWLTGNIAERLDEKPDRNVQIVLTPEHARLLCDMLKKQPEILRCKDCKWYLEEQSWCFNTATPKEETFYCADGKRKEVKGGGDAKCIDRNVMVQSKFKI